MSGPSCPPWCATEGEHDVHSSKYWWGGKPGRVSVSLLQSALEPSTPRLCFDGAFVGLNEAAALAGAMERLGHPDVAAVIRETAALVLAAQAADPEHPTGNDRASGQIGSAR
jgi:hypothetical protein